MIQSEWTTELKSKKEVELREVEDKLNGARELVTRLALELPEGKIFFYCLEINHTKLEKHASRQVSFLFCARL